jgi:hypothetical protein
MKDNPESDADRGLPQMSRMKPENVSLQRNNVGSIPLSTLKA